jgi:fructoselysine-6-P-deglycase FrlB-like protein
MLTERGSRYVYGIVSVVVIVALQGNVPDTVRWVRRSQEQRENVTYVTVTITLTS